MQRHWLCGSHAHSEHRGSKSMCADCARSIRVSGRGEQITSHKKLMLGDYSSPLISLSSAPPEREREEYKRKKRKDTGSAKAQPTQSAESLYFHPFFLLCVCVSESAKERDRARVKKQREHQQNDHSKTSSSWDELGLSAKREREGGFPRVTAAGLDGMACTQVK